MLEKHDKRAASLEECGRNAACKYLNFMGYEIIERDWECPYGTTDIIALQDDCIVFVEVRTRDDVASGFPEVLTSPSDITLFEKRAAQYLCDHGEYTDIAVRRDVIGILVVASDRAFVRHYVNAVPCDSF